MLMCLWTAGSVPAWGDDYELYSGTITEGDYIICYNGGAMKNTTYSSAERLQFESVSPTNDIITTSDASIIWHISQSGDYWTLYNSSVNKFAASTGKENKAQLLESGSDNKSLWSVSGTSTYEFVNKANKASKVNSNLRRNGDYGFACYSTKTGGALTLYKKKASSPSFTLTATSSNDSYGTVSVEDNVITATPAEGYRVSTSSAYTVTSGEANVSSVAQVGNEFTVTATGDCTVQINFEEIPSHTVTITPPLGWHAHRKEWRG